MIPVVQALEHKAPGDTAQDPALPLGQAEAGRTQDNEDTPGTRQPRAVQISAPHPHQVYCFFFKRLKGFPWKAI